MLNRIIEFEWKMLFFSPVFCLFFVQSAIDWTKKNKIKKYNHFEWIPMNADNFFFFGCYRSWVQIRFLSEHTFLLVYSRLPTMDDNNSNVESISNCIWLSCESRFIRSFDSISFGIVHYFLFSFKCCLSKRTEMPANRCELWKIIQ